jgi:hypothetical protein
MSDISEYFVAHARLARRAVARFAEHTQADIDRVANDLGFGSALTLDEVEEVLAELEDDDDGSDADEDNENDEGDEND